MQEFNQRRVGNGYDTSHFEREPLFPLPHVSTQTDGTNNEDVRGLAPTGSDADPSHLTGQVQHEPKKSLAATLVESTKKQSVALVPREIVSLARRFFPLFNIALFPHKPPSPAVANRVLFTDAEDGLLAMGLMEYNNDWKAIQQRFLPCKSENQIFVRQKNRSSSKAPENPIKAVRRMKTSPLTAEEQARIHEGLKVYKLDWMSVWKFFVPYRDPSLLPRQWRIALGTQKSYKTSEAAKAKRRVYESMRRKSKKGATNGQSVAENEVDNADGGNNSADGNMDDEEEAYVHEAFLAEWTPRNSKLMPSELPFSNMSNGNLQSGIMLPQQGMQITENRFDGMGEYGECGPMHGFMSASKFSGDLQRMSQFTYHQFSASYTANQQAPNWKSKSSCSQFNLRPYRMRKNNIVKCVKLAPDLPPVNLPPSVRVISQSAFKSYQCESSISRIRAGTENSVSSLPSVAKSGATTVNAGRNRNAVPKITGKSSHSQDPRTAIQPSTEESGAESDLQMHPLLFQAPEDGCLPYSLMNYSNSSSSTFSFFLGTPLQTNLDLLSKSQQAGGATDHFHPALRSKEAPSNLCTIDFHPLLQSADSINCEPEPLQGTCVQIPNPSNSSLSAPMVIDRQWATNTTLTNPYEKASELDLDIHLSSAASREVMGRRHRFEHRSNGSSTRAREDGTIEENQQEESRTKADSSTHVMDAHELALSSNGISRLTEDNLDEQSNPGIVMEQEELSDSDEDVGDVEFECEEMADSEGEGLGYRELDNLQNKELPSVALEEERTSTDANNGSESILMRCDPKKHILVGNSNTYSQKLVSTAKSKNIGSSTQSNSGSCTLGRSSSTLKRERRNRGYRDAGSVVQSRPVRSSKRKPNVDCVAVHSQEVPQLVLNPTTAECSTTITSTKKPKKRGCRSNPEGVEMGNYKHVSSENMVDHPDDCGMRDGQKMLNPTTVDPFPPNAKEQTDT
eukprot:TRINITY_DN36499_c0_g1_i2.p1 TRINITY_DN36499_c0_g1~~TRINITY_DN36499_c0_g1_i2.p1  ORF type:complete len:964 (+),score=215.33 TRINITY_DN36499_c0_g1_i2:1642-4533(+)